MSGLHERLLDGLVRLTNRVGSYTDAQGALRGIVRDLVGEIGLLGACVWSESNAGLAVSECAGESPDHAMAKTAHETGEPVVSGDCMAWPLLVNGRWVGALAVRGDLPEPTRAIVGMLAARI